MSTTSRIILGWFAVLGLVAPWGVVVAEGERPAPDPPPTAQVVTRAVATIEAATTGTETAPIELTLSSSSGYEGDSGQTLFPFTLSVSGSFSGTLTGLSETEGEDATSGVDFGYHRKSWSLTPTDRFVDFYVPVYGDTQVEPDETFRMIIFCTGSTFCTPFSGTSRILNDDVGATLSIGDAEIVEGDAGTSIVEFEVTLSPSAPTTVSVDYSTCGVGCHPDATATANVDYEVNVGELTFPPGATSRSIPVTINGDTTIETDEIFFVGLLDPVDASISDHEGMGTIRNDDSVLPPPGDEMVSVDPARLLETRPGEDTIDGRFEGIGQRPAGSVTELTVTGRAGIPTDADAVFLNIAAVFPDHNGYLTLYPCGTTRPLAANVNYQPGAVYPNAVLAKVGTNGTVCIYTKAATHIVADINGYVPTNATPIPVDPARVLETRPGEDTIDGRFEGIGQRPAGSVTELTVTGRAGIPTDADAVFLNIAAVFPDHNGYLTLYPCGTTRPLAANVNYQPGAVYPNAVLAKVGTNGTVCIYTKAATHIVADINGYVPTNATPIPVDPARVLETRPGEDTIDGRFEGIGQRPAGSVTELTVTGRAGIPTDADAVFLNIAAVFPDHNGYLTLYPCGTTRPLAANVNYQPGAVYPNAVLAKVGTNGTVCIYTKAATHIVADINAYIPGD